MFDSEISAGDLIEDLKTEIDVAYDIPNRSYVSWINAVEQMLYSEVIQEQAEVKVGDNGKFIIDLSSIPVPQDQDNIRFEDIYAVYSIVSGEKDIQLIKTTLTSGGIFQNCYYKENNSLGIRLKSFYDQIKIIYFVRPKLKTVNDNDEIQSGNVMLPPEFVDIVKAKLRGEACKIANEDATAAKWINDYNVLVETFKTWIQNKAPQFGM